MNKVVKNRHSEHGGASVKFLIIAVVLFLIGNAGFQFIPVAYNGENFKQEMQTAVVQAVSLPNKSPVDLARQKIQYAVQTNDIPQDALVEVKQVNNVVQAHVVYTKEVPVLPFGIYKYHYQFDHVATPTGFLTKQ